MASLVRNRVATHITWPSENEPVRNERRAALCELDGLLTQLEEINLRGTEVPGRVRAALERHSIPTRQRSAADLIEAIFEVQEQFMLRPEVGGAMPHGHARDLDELRRRLAS